MSKMTMNVYGCGNMAEAIFLSLGEFGKNFDFRFYNPTYEKSQYFADQLNQKAYPSIVEMPDADYYFISCKPQQLDELARSLRDQVPPEAIIVSIMTGMSVESISKKIGGHQNIVRAMPNLPCTIQMGVTTIYFSPSIDESFQNIIIKFFDCVGDVFVFSKEKQISDAISMNGSGPAYIFELTRIFEKHLKSLGFSNQTSRKMAIRIVVGSAMMLDTQKLSPEQLRINVTSKKGATDAVLEHLKENNFEKLFLDALQSGIKRTYDLDK